MERVSVLYIGLLVPTTSDRVTERAGGRVCAADFTLKFI